MYKYTHLIVRSCFATRAHAHTHQTRNTHRRGRQMNVKCNQSNRKKAHTSIHKRVHSAAQLLSLRGFHVHFGSGHDRVDRFGIFVSLFLLVCDIELITL